MQPSGGAVKDTDLDPSALLEDKTISATPLINTDTGSISGGVRSAGTGVINGIEFIPRGNVGVFRFRSLTISGVTAVTGSHALAIVATEGDITLGALVDLIPNCAGTSAGPGGSSGGNNAADAPGLGGGHRGLSGAGSDAGGGGGGGHGDDGGAGGIGGAGNGGMGGSAISDPAITVLVGGGGGGGGARVGDGGQGGGGGGAIQLVSNTRIQIQATGGINAGGCGGHHSNSATSGAGGGGGAGGTILLEAPVVVIDGGLAVNGGGGGGGEIGLDGEQGEFSTNRAAGGNGDTNAGDGGDGGAAGNSSGQSGANDDAAGGGGGAVGRIRINTLSGTAQVTGFTSPRLTDVPTTATQAFASLK